MKQILLIITALLSQFSFAQKKTVDYLITDVSIIPMTSETVLKNKDIAITGGKIIAISDTKKGNFIGKQTIDGKGKFIMPSLSDAHVHLPEKEIDLDKLSKLYLINGVTNLRSMRGDANHIAWKKKYNTATNVFPKLYLSAPPISKNQEFTDEQLAKNVKEAKEAGFDFIKLLSIKSEDLFKKLDSYCKENNLKIAGHFPSNPKGVIINDGIIFNSNLNSIEHLGGLIGEPSTFENRIKSMKDKNIFSCPTLRWYEIAYGEFDINTIQKQKGIEYIEPKIVAEWVDKTLKYRAKMGEKALKEELDFYAKEIDERLQVINRLNKEGIKLLLGPDSSTRFIVPGFGMMEEMQLYKRAGLSNYDILKAGTVNFAAYFNDNTYGSIEVGKNAELIILNENPLVNITTLEKIDGLLLNNNFLDKSKLDEMAKSILPTKDN
jgi:Amidohydrolase family